jgi:hypothetical protein
MVAGIPLNPQPLKAEPRLAGWRNPASVTVTPATSDPVVVTDLALGPDDDTIWVHVTTTGSEECPFPWAYAILTWVTSEGRELGSTKIHGNCEGEVFLIGNGRTPLDRAGSIHLYPRGYNLRWIDLGNPWTLDFKFETGTLRPVIEIPEGTLGDGTLGTFDPDNGGAPLDFFIEDALAYLIFNLFFK